jgi:dihydrolipoamide dehydrogenase
MTEHFNIAILGSGPGGYVAALKAAQMGAKVAVVEKSHLGGTCLNNGCIPSKALLASAELLHHIAHAADLGVEVQPPAFHWDKIQARKDDVIKTLRGGIKALFGARKVTLYAGHASLNGTGKVAVRSEGKPAQELTADAIILATGSVPARIPGWPTDPALVSTSDDSLHWKTLPKKLLIVGGGVIGCEFACMLQPMGVEVIVVEMLPRLLPFLDESLGEAMKKIFSRRGIVCHVGTKIESLEAAGPGLRAKLGDGQTIEADRALVATGRKPATADLGIETVGLSTDRGFVRVNDRMETTAKGIYCIGDANGRCLLAHAASAHGVAAVENALGHAKDFTAPIPSAVYTFPEIGSVGLTAEEAKAKKLPVNVGHFPLGSLGKAMAVNDTAGFAKVVRHRETGELLGVHMMGHNATECIAAAGALLHHKVGVREMEEVVFAHPTIAESLKEAAGDALGMALHLPPRKMLRVAAGM